MSIGSSATLGDLTEEVVSNLYGFANAYDVMVGLTADITANSRTLPLDSVDGVSRGVVEIGQELIWVDKVDRQAGTAMVPAWGRGFRSTAKSSHAAGSVITVAPTWPTSTVTRELNNVIRSLYPRLFAVGSQDFEVASQHVSVPLTAERILSVSAYDKWTDQYVPVRYWDMRRESDGVTINFFDPSIKGQQVRVDYAESPTALTDLGDLFTKSGLPESSRDVVTLGCQARLLPYLDIARLPVSSAEADEMTQTRPVGAALQLSQQLQKTYEARLLVEAGKMQDRYPVMLRRTV